MSAFNGLKLVAAKRPQAATPIVQRRNKLSNQLWEQIELARAAAEGRTYAPIKLRNVVNKVTGERIRSSSYTHAARRRTGALQALAQVMSHQIAPRT